MTNKESLQDWFKKEFLIKDNAFFLNISFIIYRSNLNIVNQRFSIDE